MRWTIEIITTPPLDGCGMVVALDGAVLWSRRYETTEEAAATLAVTISEALAPRPRKGETK